jgi:mxaJ protein
MTGWLRRSGLVRLGMAVALASAILPHGGSADAGEAKKVLRVCGDPNNMPFSNEKREGIENEIAAVLAKDLGWGLEYVWWAHQRGLVKRVLNTERCDVLVGIPKGYDLVGWTKPYYRTGYVIAYQKDRFEDVRSLDDPRLKTLRVGVQVNTPPHIALARRGIVGSNVVAYQLMYDPNSHPEDYPGKEVEDLIAGRIDVALVWGPIAGYFQKKRGAASLVLVPIEDGPGGNPTFAFDISMGVRKSDTELKGTLEQVLERKQGEIRAILQDFGVPLIPLATPAPDGSATMPDGHGGQHKGGS